MSRLAVSSLTLVLFSAPLTAAAFQHAGPDVVLASGAPVRTEPDVAFGAPRDHAGWKRFTTWARGDWRSLWDRHTGVPLRIWGSGIAAPGSSESAAAAERFARTLLAEHLKLLAPGASVSDFVLASNVLSRDVRTVAFTQRHLGLEVRGGQLSFRFKKDRLIALGSEALPNLRLAARGDLAGDAAIRRAALDWIASELGASGVAGPVAPPHVEAVVLEDGSISAARVRRVVVSTERPIGRWAVDVDASTARPFSRRQLLRFASGAVKYRVPHRHPGSTRVDALAPEVAVAFEGNSDVTSSDGIFTWTSSAPVDLTLSVIGPLVRVDNDAGVRTSTVLRLEDGGEVLWNASENEHEDAQLTTFIAASEARRYMLGVAPELFFLGRQLQATVNIAETCNAFSDGTTINFFVSGDGCQNTGRLPDVVHHEYGHSIHAHAIIEGAGSFDTALSEGASDYLAATITNDSGMGRGFFFDEEPLRELDPLGVEAAWPYDRGEPHVTGLIFAGAMWDLRKELIEKYGREAGIALADRLWYGVLQRASGIVTSYVEVLVGDDDDGDLSNGTPNLCAINAAFAAHGLASRADVGPTFGPARLEGLVAKIGVGASGLCPEADITGLALRWDVRGQSGSGGTVEMTRVGEDFEAALPSQTDGTVLRWSVEVTRASGSVESLPDNPADPMYELFIGAVTPIYCTDFESDPAQEGWTHRLVMGGGRSADEWEWGIPTDRGTGDPGAAYSGERIVGNDLGIESSGTYGRNKAEELLSPVIDASGHSQVRLQYRRWLTVEDGDADGAEILANGRSMWTNHATGSGQGTTHHIDREWRFHDVDLTEAAASNGGQVQVSFFLRTDRSLHFGGWNIDDFCIVGFDPPARCGDGVVQDGESCDDGNGAPGDGCEADCTTTGARCGDGQVDSGEQCDDGNGVAGDGCEPGCIPTPASICGAGTVERDGRCVEDPGLETLDSEGGCGCSASQPANSGGLWIWPALAAILLLRRRAR